MNRSLCLPLLLLLSALPVAAQHHPYFVTYTHEMEEVGNLEWTSVNVVGTPRGGRTFLGSQLELEYGARGWWSTALYLDGQTTAGQSTVFTGFRWENRFRMLRREHWINPVLYVEFARVNESNKSLREIVGHDVEGDQTAANAAVHQDVEKELELKLILSSHVKGWNVAENFIAEKPLGHDPWEFGYAFGVSRPLAFVPSGKNCNFCRENMQAGVELYGGLGDSKDFSTRMTSHYIAPTFAWKFAPNANARLSPGFGLNGQSHRYLLRFGLTYEINDFGSKVAGLFRAR